MGQQIARFKLGKETMAAMINFNFFLNFKHMLITLDLDSLPLPFSKSYRKHGADLHAIGYNFIVFSHCHECRLKPKIMIPYLRSVQKFTINRQKTSRKLIFCIAFYLKILNFLSLHIFTPKSRNFSVVSKFHQNIRKFPIFVIFYFFFLQVFKSFIDKVQILQLFSIPVSRHHLKGPSALKGLPNIQVNRRSDQSFPDLLNHMTSKSFQQQS